MFGVSSLSVVSLCACLFVGVVLLLCVDADGVLAITVAFVVVFLVIFCCVCGLLRVFVLSLICVAVVVVCSCLLLLLDRRLSCGMFAAAGACSFCSSNL